MIYEEFERLVKDVGPEVYSFCLQLSRNREEAEELYQETMLAAVERQEKIDACGNPGSYLLGISIGLWKNFRRKKARRGRILPESPLEEQLEQVYMAEGAQSPEEEIVAGEEAALVRRAVAGLPEKYRIPVYLYYSRELSVEEIAGAMHIPKGTVKSRLHKARCMIKECVEAEGYEIG